MSTLKSLLALRSDKLPIISVYVNTDQKARSVKQIQTEVKQLFKAYKGETPEEINLLAHAASDVQEYLATSLAPGTRGAAFFLGGDEDEWEVYSFSTPFDQHQLFVERSPYIRPLVSLLSTYAKVGAIVFNRKQLRTFTYHLGTLAESESFGFELPGFTDKERAAYISGIGHGGQGENLNLEEGTFRRQFHAIAPKLLEWKHQAHVDQLILIGPSKITPWFEGELNTELTQVIGARVDVNVVHETLAHLKERIEPVVSQMEQAKDAARIERLMKAVGEDKRGVNSLPDVLSAVMEGRALVLYLSETANVRGAECRGCGYLSAMQMSECPYCKGSMREIEDLIEPLIKKAIEKDAHVEFVHQNAEFEKLGGIAAVLRYK